MSESAPGEGSSLPLPSGAEAPSTRGRDADERGEEKERPRRNLNPGRQRDRLP